MPHFSTRIRTSRSASDAFAYLSDVRNFAQWDPGTTSSVQVRGDGPGPGAEYDLKSGGAQLTYTVQHFDPPALIRLRGKSKAVTSIDTITVRPDGEGCIVTYDAELRGNGLMRLFDPVLAVLFRRLGEGAAKGLTTHLPGTRLS
jgi:hypothetical protein